MSERPSLMWLCFILYTSTIYMISTSQSPSPHEDFLKRLPCVKHGRPMRFLCTDYQHLKPETGVLDHSDTFGRSWIHRAAICGDCEELQQAILNGANVAHTDHNSLTPLHYAAHAFNSWEVVSLLLPHYGDDQYDARDKYGMTPLAYMILFDKPAAAAELLYRGALFQHPVTTGTTITDIAIHFNNQACLTLITECKKETKPGRRLKSRINELQNLLESTKIKNIPGDLVGLILSMLPCDLRENYKSDQPSAVVTQ